MSRKMPSMASRLSRRAALRAAAVAGVVGSSAAFSAAGAAAQDASGRMMHLEMDAVIGTPVSIVRAGSGPPQRGDWFFVDAVIHFSSHAQCA